MISKGKLFAFDFVESGKYEHIVDFSGDFRHIIFREQPREIKNADMRTSAINVKGNCGLKSLATKNSKNEILESSCVNREQSVYLNSSD